MNKNHFYTHSMWFGNSLMIRNKYEWKSMEEQKQASITKRDSKKWTIDFVTSYNYKRIKWIQCFVFMEFFDVIR